MNLVLGICAAVAALVGLGLLYWRSRVGSELALMASVETSGAGSVAQMAPGAIVEVKGTLRVPAPLTAEFSQQLCAYYKCEIEREEVYYERDSQGRDQRRTRTTTVYSNIDTASVSSKIRPVRSVSTSRARRSRRRRPSTSRPQLLQVRQP